MEKEEKRFIIAIDGPSATGKGSTAKQLANRLSILYLDTGAMYRAAAYYFISNDIKITEENARIYMDQLDINISCTDNKIKVVLNNDDITEYIRTNQISMGASDISKIEYVRERLVAMQRKMAKNISMVLEGRDIGSVVFPNADLKVYLDADPKVRAARRQKDLEKLGQYCSIDEVQSEMEKRDFQDSNRKNSPLVKTKDAILIDNTNMSVNEVVNYIIKLLYDKNIIQEIC